MTSGAIQDGNEHERTETVTLERQTKTVLMSFIFCMSSLNVVCFTMS